jgi:hypothetical protein
MRKLALPTCLIVAAAALAGIAGVVTAAVVDPGSGLVVAVVVALGLLVIGLLEWTHRRHSGVLRASRAHQSAPAYPRSAGTTTPPDSDVPGSWSRPGEFDGRI